MAVNNRGLASDPSLSRRHSKCCYVTRMLQKVAKFFYTDIGYILRGGSWLGASRVVSSLAALLLLLAFGNLLSKGAYGIYQYVLSIAATLSVTTLPGMTTALTQAVAKGQEGVFYEMTRIRIAWGLVGGSLCLILGAYYFLQENAELCSVSSLPGCLSPL
jgi:O-antigen/teichoic acid export membrane protein